MLWTKDSTRDDAMYVDLYAANGGKTLFEKHNCLIAQQAGKPGSVFNKNDAVSSQKWKEGNRLFGQGKWKLAIEKYNESLCFAQNESKNISYAYANRSTCFLKLKMYNECLIDIELAKDSGYPDALMQKLDERKETCLKAIDEGNQPTKFEPKLSFEPDERVPFMANVLKLDRSADGSLVFFAKEDIDVGQTIVEEKIRMSYLYTQYKRRCNICLKDCVNLVPCKKCTAAMFCSEECVGNPLHDYECGLRFSTDSVMNGTTMRVVRNVLLAINMFSGVDEFMDFVEQAVSGDHSQNPSTLLDSKSQYAAWLKLPIKPPSQDRNEHFVDLSIAFSTQKMLMKVQKMNAMFKAEKHRRFLTHLIAHHYKVMENNSCIIGANDKSDDDEDYEALLSKTGLTMGYLRHSCAPNVMAANVHDKLFLITVRPIKQREQIVHTIDLALLNQPTYERQLFLWQNIQLKCKCLRCEGANASRALRTRMRLDPNFKYIMSKQRRPIDGVTIQEVISKCKVFLQKYGQNPFCNEIGRVVAFFTETLICKQ